MTILKLLWLDLVGGLVCHKITTYESAVMTFLGVYIDTTLSMAKHTDHISRSANLAIGKISSVRHLLTRKATTQLMCSFVQSLSFFFTILTFCSLNHF